MSDTARADQQSPSDPVLERLDELRRDSIRAERVYQYVATGHDADCSTTDLLHVLRDAPDLALETRGNMGRAVVCALEDDSGEARYPMWEHSAVASSLDTDAQTRSVEYHRDVKTRLEDRRPRVRLREDTPLAELDAPAEWDRIPQPGEVIRGP